MIAPRTLDSEAWAKPYCILGRQWTAKHKESGFRVFLCEDKPGLPCSWVNLRDGKLCINVVNRRSFLCAVAASPVLAAADGETTPKYRICTHFAPARKSGMPGAYFGQVVRVFSEKSIDATSARVDRAVVKQMLSAGMRSLTGDSSDADCWARFFDPHDIIGIKVNCSGAPHIMSSPELISGILKT